MDSKRDKFSQNKYIWNKLFFNRDYPKMNWTHTQIDQFWNFVSTYYKNKQHSDQKLNSKGKERQRSKVQELVAKWMGDQGRQSLPLEWLDLEVLQSKLRTFGLENELDKKEIVNFREVLLIYCDWQQQHKLKKIEKLKCFQQSLPIYQHKQHIMQMVNDYSVMLIAGETGCGKSTQLPQYLLYAGFEKICCTQPRRLACISLRNRLAIETGNEFGSEIGYQIRFEKHKSKHTKILFLTEGLLLRQMSEDPYLSNYNIIILDEIHERHIACDFLLGAIKVLLNRRKGDLKVLLMSATVNCELFSSYFGKCPVVKVTGRVYPVKVEYFPVDKFAQLKTSTKINPEPYLKMLRLIDRNHERQERGDVLVFLSGALEIETVGEVLKSYAEENGRWVVLYLHSGLPIAEQDKVFDIAPEGTRKCILATNIAETSLTIDGIRFVIDSGKVKEMHYNAELRLHKLQEIWVSKASAEQRKGRAGRTGPGVCFRLYSRQEFEQFSNFSIPEIKRVSLESTLLTMVSLGLPDVRQFPFLESPGQENVENTLKCLIEYGALDQTEDLTMLGRILVKLPVDIAIGKMLVMALLCQLVHFFLSAAGCLSIQSLISSRSLTDKEAIEERKHLICFEGDLFFYIKLYSRWLVMRAQAQNTRRWCRKLALDEQRFYELTKLRNQFNDILKDTGLVQVASASAGVSTSQQQKLSKSERMMKHGERKLYRQAKRDYESSKHKRRKVLSLGEQQSSNNDQVDDSNNPEVNIKDLEFKMLFDASHLLEVEQGHILKHDELQLAKLIICMSFYPQLAIPDADNSNRNDSEQMFHTKSKPFVVLHPSSLFYGQPELLRPQEVERLPMGAFSSSHILLGYLSFIETTKTYICNCYPISAIHALLISAREIDTNIDTSRMVFDEWIEVQCITWEDSQHILLQALQIRALWDCLLKQLFQGLERSVESALTDMTACDTTTATDPAAAAVDLLLQSSDSSDNLAQLRELVKQFLSSKPKYTLKRLLPADVKHLHSKKALSPASELLAQRLNKLLYSWLMENCNPNDIKPNDQKGGLCFGRVNYNCLTTSSTDQAINATRKLFDCDCCGEQMFLNALERARHQELCAQKQRMLEKDDKQKEMMNNTSDEQKKSKESAYYCTQCEKYFSFSAIDILRHRKTHE